MSLLVLMNSLVKMHFSNDIPYFRFRAIKLHEKGHTLHITLTIGAEN